MNVLKLLKRKYLKVDNNVLLFMSFYGKYADSPKVLSESIHRLAPEKKIVWSLNNIDDVAVPDYVIKIKFGSSDEDFFYGRARAVIDNTYCDHGYFTEGDSIDSRLKFKIVTFLKNKKHQKYYSFWHGTMIKKIGSDSVRNNSFNFSCSNTTMFLDNLFARDVMERITKNTIDIKMMGEPRNDILFRSDVNKKVLKEKLGLSIDKKIIIYAPTFRSNDDETKNVNNSGIRQLEELDIDKLLNILAKRFGGEWVFVTRFHYHVEQAIDWKKINKKYGDRVINGNKSDDIMDYLVCCDAMLTDVSSCVYDFSLTNKPAFLFFPDYDHYMNDERGLYFKKEELPWDVSMNCDELYESIKKFDQKDYCKRIDDFYKRLGFLPKEPCADKIADYILKDLDRKNESSK